MWGRLLGNNRNLGGDRMQEAEQGCETFEDAGEPIDCVHVFRNGQEE